MAQQQFLEPLSEADQRGFGIDRPAPFAYADRVRFGELDALNHVNNIAFLTWCEVARVRWFQLRELSQYTKTDPRLVVFKSEITYLQEMHADDPYLITCRATEYRRSSFTLSNEIWSKGTLRSRHSAVIVVLKPDGSEKLPLPEDFIDRIRTIEGAVPA